MAPSAARERQQLETHAHELQQLLQDQQNLRHAQQQQREQQQDEEANLEQQRQKLEQQRQQLQQHQQQLSEELHLQLQQQQQAQQHPPTGAAAAPNAHHGQPQHPQPHAAQPGPHTITTQQQTYPPHHGQTAQLPGGGTDPDVGPTRGEDRTARSRRTRLRRHAADDSATADEGRRTHDGNGTARMGSSTAGDGWNDTRIGDAGRPAPHDEHGGRRVHRRRVS